MKVLLFANTDWYLYNFRLQLADTLRRSGIEVILLSPAGDYVKKLQAQGFRWMPFPLSRRGMNPFMEGMTLIRLVRLYRLERPDLLHHFTIKCVLYGSLAGHAAGIPSIVNSVTGLGYLYIGGGLIKKFLRHMIKIMYRLILKGTQVIFQNEDDREELLDHKMVRKEKTHLVRGSGVDVNLFKVTPEPKGVPVALLAARMLWDKGVGEFVAAADMLRSSAVAARFILVGDTYQDNPAAIPNSQLESWVRQGIVEWWGWLEDMPAVYARANIVCLPSYREGMPRSLMEASACGRAVVAADVPGCRHAVRHAENGLLVPVRDARALAEALKELIEKPALRRRMGVKGRKLAEEEFSVERIVSETIAIYRYAGLHVYRGGLKE